MAKLNKVILSLLVLICINLLPAESVFAVSEPNYTGWIGDYDGNEPNTVYLWTMEQIYRPPTSALAIKDSITGADNRLYVNAAVGTDANTYVDVPGRFGKGVFLPGGADGNDRLLTARPAESTDANNGTDFVGTDVSFSIELWAKSDGIPVLNENTSSWLVCKSDQTYDYVTSGFVMYLVRDKTARLFLRVGIGTTGGTAYVQKDLGQIKNFDETKWNHYAMTWDASTDTLVVFVNGKNVGSDSYMSGCSYVPAKDTKLRVGQRILENYGTWHGTLDNVRFSNIAYGYDPAYTSWTSNYTGNEPNTVYLWNMNLLNKPPANALAVRDVITDNNNRLFVSAGDGKDANDYVETPSFWRWGYSVSLPGGSDGNDRLLTAKTADGNTTNHGTDFVGSDTSLTVELWAKSNGIPTDVNASNIDWLVCKSDQWYNEVNDGFVMYMARLTDGRLFLRAGLGTTAGAAYVQKDMSELVLDEDYDVTEWNHYAMAWNASDDTFRLFVNGEMVGEMTKPGGQYAPALSSKLHIGQRLAAGYGTWNGLLENIRFSNKAYVFGPPFDLEKPFVFDDGPYYDWVNEYQENNDNPCTLGLWNFNQSDINDYTHDTANYRYAKVQPDRVGYGGLQWDARYNRDSATLKYDVNGGKWGGDLNVPGVLASGGQCQGYRAGGSDIGEMTLFPFGTDPALSVECWVKFKALPDVTKHQFLVSKGRAWTAYGTGAGQSTNLGGYDLFYSYIEGDGYRSLRWIVIGDDGLTVMETKKRVSLQTDTWYHIAGTWDPISDTAKIFLNGENIATAVFPGKSITVATGWNRQLVFGDRALATYWPFNGVIDGVRISQVPYDYAIVPQCGEEGAVLTGDISGPNSVPDCKDNFYDLKAVAMQWLNNTIPTGGAPDPNFFTQAPDVNEPNNPDKVYPAGRKFQFSFYSAVNPYLVDMKEYNVTSSGPHYDDVNQIPTHLPRADFLDLKFIYRLGASDWASIPGTDAGIRSLVEGQMSAIPSNLKQSIGWWYLMPEEPNRSSAQWASQLNYMHVAYDAIHASGDANNKPVWTYEANGKTQTELAQTVPYQDICGHGSYVSDANHHKNERIWVKWSIEQEVNAVAIANPNAVPIMVGWMAGDPNDQSEDSLIETWCRHDMYLAFVTGAKGVVIWSADPSRTGFERTYETYLDAYMDIAEQLNGELGLADVLLFGQKKSDVNVAITSGPNTVSVTTPAYTAPSINYLNMADTRGWRHLFMVNSANSVVGVNITGLPNSGAWKRNVLSSDGYTTIAGGSFTATFAPLETKVFRIIPAPASCGDEGTTYLDGDITGSAGVPDCRVNFRDFAELAMNWFEQIDPENP